MTEVQISDDAQLILYIGYTWSKQDDKNEYPFVTAFLKAKKETPQRINFNQKGTCFFESLKGRISKALIMPKKQDGFFFFVVFDKEGNMMMCRTNGLEF